MSAADGKRLPAAMQGGKHAERCFTLLSPTPDHLDSCHRCLKVGATCMSHASVGDEIVFASSRFIVALKLKEGNSCCIEYSTNQADLISGEEDRVAKRMKGGEVQRKPVTGQEEVEHKHANVLLGGNSTKSDIEGP